MDAPSQQANSTLGFSALSDDLLCQVFSQLDDSRDRHALPQVCQRWNAVFSSSGILLQFVYFDPAARGVKKVDATTCSFLRWLQRRWNLVRALLCHVYCCTATADILWQLDRLEVLNVLLSNQLTDLQPLFEAIGKLPILRFLEIYGESWTADITPLQHLTSLGKLALGAPCTISTGVNALASGATCLTSLDLVTSGYLDLAPLSALQVLTYVCVRGTRSQPDRLPGLNIFLQGLVQLEKLNLSDLNGVTRLDLSAQIQRQLTSLYLDQMQGLRSFPEGLAAHSKLQRFVLILSGLHIDLHDFFAPCMHIWAQPLPQLQHLCVAGAVAPTAFPAAVTRLTALTTLILCMAKGPDQFSRLDPGLTALQQLRTLTVSSLPRLELDVGIILALPRLQSLAIECCDNVTVEGGLCMLIRNHSHLTSMTVPGTNFSYDGPRTWLF